MFRKPCHVFRVAHDQKREISGLLPFPLHVYPWLGLQKVQSYDARLHLMKYRLKLFSSSAVRGSKWQYAGGNCIMRSFTTCTLHPLLLGWSKQRRMRWACHVARTRKTQNSYKILVRKPETKRLLLRLRNRWKDNIKMDIRKRVWEGVDWIHLAQNTDH
jgi:hypothetical protein